MEQKNHVTVNLGDGENVDNIPPKNSLSTDSNKKNIFGNICGCSMYLIILILVGSLFFSFPIVQIAYGSTYTVECESPINVSVSSWLIVNGVTHIIVLIVVSFMYFVGLKSCGTCIEMSYYIFWFSWLIVGSVLYFRDCKNIEPKSIDTLTVVTLIFSYIELGALLMLKPFNK